MNGDVNFMSSVYRRDPANTTGSSVRPTGIGNAANENAEGSATLGRGNPGTTHKGKQRHGDRQWKITSRLK